MSPRCTPPFRADHVGRLLRPPAVLDARRKLESRQISADELRRIEDDAIRRVIKRQEQAGLQCATDGELRRSTWHMDRRARRSCSASSPASRTSSRARTTSSGASMQQPSTSTWTSSACRRNAALPRRSWNVLTEDEQFAKLALVVETAREVWG
jgi:hypothetical protein